MYLSKKITKFDFSADNLRVSIQLVTYGFHPKSCGFIYKIPARLTYTKKNQMRKEFHCIFIYTISNVGIIYNSKYGFTVAGVAVLKLDISKIRRIVGVSAMRSLLANVKILLSSITVFKLSIHLPKCVQNTKMW